MNENKTPHKKSANQQVDYQYARVQPQALDIERAVLGALMIDKDAYTIISNILKTTDFYEPRNQRVFEAISDLYHAEDGQKPIDVLTVTDRLEKNGTLEEIGGPAYIAELSSRIASSANIEYHANIIAQKALARELIKFGSMVVDKAFDETTIIDDLISPLHQVIPMVLQESPRDMTSLTVIQAAGRIQIWTLLPDVLQWERLHLLCALPRTLPSTRKYRLSSSPWKCLLPNSQSV